MNNPLINKMPVGIDPHKDSCGICLVHPSNDEILDSFNIKNCSQTDTEFLIRKASFFARYYNTSPVFVFESTNVFWRPMFSYLQRAGLECVTVNSYQTKNLRRTLMRKTKTDAIDAKLIADLYKQGKYHETKFHPEPLFSLRELTRLFKFLVDIKARLLNRIYTYLFEIFPEIFAVIPKTSLNTLLTLLKFNLASPQNIINTRVDKLSNILKNASHGKINSSKAEKLKSVAESSFGIPEGNIGFSAALSTLASLYLTIDELLSALENGSIKPLLESVPQKLNTIKGLGSNAAASFVSELGNPHDFNSADSALAFFGLDPVIAQSGRSSGTGHHISHSGTKYGRESMFLAAGTCILHNPKFKEKYKRLKANGRKPKDAKTIIAADLVKICFAMYRDQSDFNPDKLN